MKKLILVVTLLIVTNYSFSQSALPYAKKAKIEKIVKDTTINNVKYPIYEGSKGGNYLYITSKIGSIYKKYLKATK